MLEDGKNSGIVIAFAEMAQVLREVAELMQSWLADVTAALHKLANTREGRLLRRLEVYCRYSSKYSRQRAYREMMVSYLHRRRRVHLKSVFTRTRL